MAQKFIACDREQELLLPPSLREWLPEDHLAWLVLDAVAAMDLAEFYAAYRADGHGRAAHDPAMMVALLLYAYAVGERSSRAVERRCLEDIAFGVIAANQAPDHATVARFGVRHEEALAGLFGQVLALCARAGAIQVGVIAVDGTKVHANASDRQNRSYEQLAKEILQEADAVDAAEDAQFGEARGDELPPELAERNSRRERLREAKRQLEAELDAQKAELEQWRQAKADYVKRTGRKIYGPPKPRPVPDTPTRRINLTDPDSRAVKTARGFLQGYTARAVATKEQFVIAAEVRIGGNERSDLGPLIDQACDQLDAAGIKQQPELVLADAGYRNGPHINQLAARGIPALVPPDADTRRQPSLLRRGGHYDFMRSVLNRDDGRALYKQRQAIIEPVFAQTKVTRRADRFQRRGLAACNAEWRLSTATHNLLKLWRTGLATA
jgi:transposase